MNKNSISENMIEKELLRERERVCVCVRERKRERERECVCVRERLIRGRKRMNGTECSHTEEYLP